MATRAPYSRNPPPEAAPVAGSHAVLLIGGLQHNEVEYKFLASEAQRAGLAVHLHRPLAPEQGIGESRTCYRTWVNHALGRFDALKARHERVSIVGLGVGATLALKLAALRSNVNAAVLISTTLSFDGWAVTRFLPLLTGVPLRYWCRYRTTAPYGLKNTRLREWSARQMRHADARGASLPMTAICEARRLGASVRRSLDKVVVPLLLLHAKEDDVASLRNVKHVAAKAASTEVEIEVFDNSYHLLCMDNDKEAVAARVLEFLGRHSQARAQTLPSGRAEPALGLAGAASPPSLRPQDPGPVPAT